MLRGGGGGGAPPWNVGATRPETLPMTTHAQRRTSALDAAEIHNTAWFLPSIARWGFSRIWTHFYSVTAVWERAPPARDCSWFGGSCSSSFAPQACGRRARVGRGAPAGLAGTPPVPRGDPARPARSAAAASTTRPPHRLISSPALSSDSIAS